MGHQADPNKPLTPPPSEGPPPSPRRRSKPCSRKLLAQLAGGLLLTVVVIFQSGILNFFIVRRFRDSIAPYFWFVADLLCVLLFAATLTVAYRDTCASSGGGGRAERDKQYDARRRQELVTHLPLTARLGSLPYSYGSWLFYSALLVAKIVLIFKAGVPQHLKSDEFFGPQVLKLSIALSAVVLALLVEGHHDSAPDSSRNAYISTVCMSACFDVMDSVSFLSLLFTHESHLVFSFAFENVILGFACLNILLPALTLYRLSLSGFGNIYTFPAAAFYKFLHLCLVNIPYMGVRIYLWSFLHSDISVFLVKNIWASLIILRTVVKEMPCKCPSRRTVAPRNNGAAIELGNVSTVSGGNNHHHVVVAPPGNGGKKQASSAC